MHIPAIHIQHLAGHGIGKFGAEENADSRDVFGQDPPAETLLCDHLLDLLRSDELLFVLDVNGARRDAIYVDIVDAEFPRQRASQPDEMMYLQEAANTLTTEPKEQVHSHLSAAAASASFRQNQQNWQNSIHAPGSAGSAGFAKARYASKDAVRLCGALEVATLPRPSLCADRLLNGGGPADSTDLPDIADS